MRGERLDSYSELIRGFVQQYGEEAWPFVSQADSRMRSEQLDRIKRELRAVPAHGYEECKPWSACFAAAVKENDFWQRELATPALLFLTRNKNVIKRHGRQSNLSRAISRGPNEPAPQGGSRATTSPRLGRTVYTPTTERASRCADCSTRESVGQRRHKGSARATAATSATGAWGHTWAPTAHVKTDPIKTVAPMAVGKPPTSEHRQRRRDLHCQVGAPRG